MRSLSLQAAVLLVGALLKFSFAADCAAGRFSLNGKSPCKECAWGEFQARIGQTSCTRCVPGRFNDQETVPRIKCEKCPPGKTSGLNGIPLYRCDPVLTPSPTPHGAPPSSPPTPSPNVSRCPAGRYLVVAAIDSSEHCLVCPAGKMSSPSRVSGCDQCAVGRVAGAPGMHVCIPCGQGRFSDSRRVQCVRSCPPGDVETNGGGCATCPAGKISQKAASTECTSCPAGQYSNAGDLAARTRSRCVASCAPGEFGTANSACELCPVGRFTATSGSSNCALCPVGQVTYARGEDTCSMPCPSGRYRHAPAFAKNMKVRPVGHPGSCTGCPPGKYQPLTVSTSCKLCEAGRYQSRPGQVTCSNCASGKISAPGSDARDACIVPCPKGRFHLHRMAGCLDCLPGYYQDVEGRDRCQQCGLGHFSSRPGAKHCKRCPGAQLSVFTRTACVASCPVGSLRTSSALSTGADGCERCPAGKHSHSISVACTQCPHGQLSNPARSACIAEDSCRAGMYSDGFGCDHCSRGRYHPNQPPSTHSTTGLSVDCYACSRGRYQAHEGGSRCDGCPRGKHSPDGAPGCVPCSIGHFAPANSVGTCDMCPLGKFSASEGGNGAISCSVCPAGQVSLASRAGCTAIFTCEAGTFKKKANQGCTYCAAGHFQPSGLGSLQAMPSCKACGTGHFSSRGAVECTECVEGYEVNADRTMCRAPTPPPTPAPPTPKPSPNGNAGSGSGSGGGGAAGGSGGVAGARAASHFFIYGSFALRRETKNGWEGGESHKRKQMELALHYAVREPAVEARVTRVVAGHFSRGVYVAFTLNCKAKGIRDSVNERMDGVAFLHSLAGQLRAAGFNVQAGELHFSHTSWNPTAGSGGSSSSPDGQGADQRASEAAGASPVKPWHKTTVFAVALLAGAVAIMGGCMWYLHWDKSSRRSRVNNYAQFNALPDSHHQVKPFFEKAEENIISGSDEDDEDGTLGGLLGTRSHRRDNEISDSDGDEDVDWVGDGERMDKRQLKGLDAFKSSAAASKSKRTRQRRANSGETQEQDFGGYQQQANDDYDTNEI